MGLYPPLESGEIHRLQHVAEVRFRLKRERDFRASMYKKYRRGANVADGIDAALAVTSVGLAASGVDNDDDFMFNDASTHWVICV